MIQIDRLDPSDKFKSDLKSAPVDVQAAVKDALELLQTTPMPKKLRLHRLSGYKPSLWKIDIFPNKSWQIALEVHGSTARLMRLGTHRQMDRL